MTPRTVLTTLDNIVFLACFPRNDPMHDMHAGLHHGVRRNGATRRTTLRGVLARTTPTTKDSQSTRDARGRDYDVVDVRPPSMTVVLSGLPSTTTESMVGFASRATSTARTKSTSRFALVLRG